MRTPLLLALAVATLFSACKKDEDNDPTPAPAGTTQPSMDALRNYVTQQRTAATQSFTFMGSGGGYFLGAQGTLLWVNSFAFHDAMGVPVAGPVTVEMVEAYSVGDMVRLNMRTVATDGAQHLPLQSGGELRLRATSNGAQVMPGEESVLIYAPYEDFSVAGMRPYLGEEDAEGNLLWTETGEELVDTTLIYSDNTGAMQVADSGYVAWWPPPPSINPWPDYTFFNIDHPLPFTGAGTNVIVHPNNIDLGYGTMIFLVLPELDCMIYFETGDPDARASGCLVPVGAQGIIVACAFTSTGELRAAFVPTTVTQDHEQSITLQTMTEAEYQAALDAL